MFFRLVVHQGNRLKILSKFDIGFKNLTPLVLLNKKAMATNGTVQNGTNGTHIPKKMADPPQCKKTKSSTPLELFDELFPVLVDDLTKQGMKDTEIESAMKWFKRVTEYNVPFGKKNRGLTVAESYQYLQGDKTTEDDMKIARVLGWCVEFLQAYFLVTDDIMDQSVTRRGRPCWYKVDGVGLEAINDALYIESAIYTILKKYIRDKPYYIDVVELFHETNQQTVIGQSLDMLTAPLDRVDFTDYTIARYNAIVKFKTAFYSFYLPVASAMYMAGIMDSESHNNAKTILLKMGEFFQIQDDYLDCYGDPAVTGKVGTDIEDNKCSWLCVQALAKSNEDQKKVLQENYAQHDAEKVAKVKELFADLKLKDAYFEYEEQSYQDLQQLIETHSQSLPKEMFVAFGKKIYKRQK